MPKGTEWVRGVCPTALSGRGNDALTAWMDGGITGELRGDVEGHGGPEHENGGPWGPIRGGRAPEVAGLGAYGPEGTRNGGHTAPEVAGLGGVRPRRLQDGPTDIESLRQEAVWHRDPAEWGSWTAGQSGTEGCEYEIGGSPVAARLRGYRGNTAGG